MDWLCSDRCLINGTEMFCNTTSHPHKTLADAVYFAEQWCKFKKIMRTFTLIAASLIASGNASAEQFSTILAQCWEGNDHPKMSACVKLRASQARASLNTVEREMREAIANSREPAYINTAAAVFDANMQSFQKYRKDQCSFVFTLAAVGNGAEDNKRACEAQLDIARMEQLKAASWWLK